MGADTVGARTTGWLPRQRGSGHGGRRDRVARRVASVDAGSAGMGAGGTWVALCRFRGLTRACHASECGLHLTHLGWVMLGVRV